MKLTEIHPALQHALGCYEGFRRCGFTPDEIFIVHSGTQDIVFVILETQGKTFSIGAGYLPCNSEEEWKKLALPIFEAVKNGALSEADMQACWEQSLPYRHTDQFLMKIAEKGIKIPNVDKWKNSKKN